MERNYLIIGKDGVSLINYDEILQTSEESLRYSIDGNKTIIKWVGDEPNFVSSTSYKEGPFTQSEILDILKTSEWTIEEQ